MKFLKFSLPLWALLSFSISEAQNVNPNDDSVYRSGEIATLKLTMSAQDKDELIFGSNPQLRNHFPATITFNNSILDTTVENIGVRNRGNTSIDNQKRPLKIDFKEFGGEKLFNYKKFNLKAEGNDPSMVREFLALRLFREVGVPAARASYVKLYVNDEYMGLYLNIEQIDDEFADTRFGSEGGNLYKCLYQGNPAELRDEASAYNNTVYELKTNEDINDRAKLVEFIGLLNNTSKPAFEKELQAMFKLDLFLKYMAMEALLGHWDSPTMLSNNYYLYEDEESGQLVLIPYDLDNILGIDWLGADWATYSFDTWGAGFWQSNALSVAVNQNPEYKLRYQRYVATFIDLLFNEESLFPILDSLKDMIAQAIETDSYYPLDMGYSYSDFTNAYTSNFDTWVDYGVKTFITQRISLAENELSTAEPFETLFPDDPYKLVSGIEPTSQAILKRFDIFPNPLRGDYFYLKLDDNLENGNISVFDAMGREIEVAISKSGENITRITGKFPEGILVIDASGYRQTLVVVR